MPDLLQLQGAVASNMQGHTNKLDQLWNVENSLQSLLNHVESAQLNHKCKTDIRDLVAGIRHSSHKVDVLIQFQNRAVMEYYVFYVRSLIQILDNYALEREPLKILEYLSDDLAIKIDGDLKQLRLLKI